jgi:tetratricopeptide (TPR) repeat protein
LAAGENHSSTLDFDEAIRLDPKSNGAYLGRARARRNMKEYDRAVADADQAIRLAPTLPHGYFERAEVRRVEDDARNALLDYGEAIRVDPTFAPAYNMRAWVLATCPHYSVRKGELAAADARKACELAQWQEPDYLDTLAAAEAECGRFDEAIRYENKALENERYAKTKTGEAARWRLKVYQEGKAFRDGAPAAAPGPPPEPGEPVEKVIAGDVFKGLVAAAVLFMVAFRMRRLGVWPFRRRESHTPFEVVERAEGESTPSERAESPPDQL